MWKEKVKDFVWTQRLWFVSIPGIAGLHWVWWKIQCDDRFVAEHERKPFPFVVLYRYFRDRMTEPKPIQEGKTVGGG